MKHIVDMVCGPGEVSNRYHYLSATVCTVIGRFNSLYSKVQTADFPLWFPAQFNFQEF